VEKKRKPLRLLLLLFSLMSMSLSLPSAPQAEILRSHQKDQHYESMLHGQVEEVLVQIMGNRAVLKHSVLIKLLTAITYYALNTMHTHTHTHTHNTSAAAATATLHFHHGQTLGEEYCDIRPIALPTSSSSSSTSSSSSLPVLVSVCVSFVRSVVYCVLQYVIVSVIGELPVSVFPVSVQPLIPPLKSLFQEYLQPLHLALFYFTGKYHSISKRLAGITYIFSRQLRLGEDRPGYQFLGVLIILQLASKATLAALARLRHNHQQQNTPQSK